MFIYYLNIKFNSHNSKKKINKKKKHYLGTILLYFTKKDCDNGDSLIQFWKSATCAEVKPVEIHKKY